MIERGGLLAGVATLGVLLPGGAPAEAIPTKYNHISEAAAKAIRHNAAYLKGIGCSAWLLRDIKGEIEGLATADHCLESETHMTGSDGKGYIVQPEDVWAEIGKNVGYQHPVAEIDKWILPGTATKPDNSHDIAIGVAYGHTPPEAKADFKRIKLPASRLDYGDKLYGGAFPTTQPQNLSGIMRRQMFNLTFNGPTDIALGSKPFTHTLDMWMSATPDGATCGPGGSGSGAVEVAEHEAKLAAILSASPMTDIREKGVGKKGQRQNPFEGSICYYADRFDPRNSSTFTPVRSVEEIPGYTTIEEKMESIHTQFEDSGISKTIVNGTVYIPSRKGGPDTPAFTDVEDPVIIHFTVPDTTFFIWARSNTKDPDQLNFAIFDSQSLGQALIVPRSQDRKSDFLASAGAIKIVSETDNSGTQDLFVDEVGQQFGKQYGSSLPSGETQYYRLDFSTGNHKLSPIRKR